MRDQTLFKATSRPDLLRHGKHRGGVLDQRRS